MSLNKYQTIKVYDSAGNLVQDGPNAPEPVVGTFTCATLNVDGLPKKIGLITINGDGPGESGTTAIGNAVNSLGWDFMAVSEDFEYHSQLAAALSNYDAGKWRGTITSAQLTSRAIPTASASSGRKTASPPRARPWCSSPLRKAA